MTRGRYSCTAVFIWWIDDWISMVNPDLPRADTALARAYEMV